MSFGKTTPILRIFDDSKAKEFYGNPGHAMGQPGHDHH
jgi:hypothetical protein